MIAFRPGLLRGVWCAWEGSGGMGSFWATGGQVAGMMAELIGTKLGLAVTSDDLAKAMRERDLSDSWPDDYHVLYRYRSEVWEHMVLVLLDAFGDPEADHVRRSPLITRSMTKEFGDAPEVWEAVDKTLKGLSSLKATADGKSLDPGPLVDAITAEYGPSGGLLAIRILQEINARVFTSPWSSVSRQDFDSVLPLRNLFASEELPSALGMFFDQRFIDFLHANLDDVGTMHWRQFEGLVAERLRRSGLHVELGPGRNDEGIDIRAWDAEPRSDDPALLLVQCKRTSAKVDRVVVKALAADVMFEGATRGLVATTSAWSPGARATVQARGYPVDEANRDTIRDWLHSMRTIGAGPWMAD